MVEDDIGFKSAVELALCIRKKEISPVELTEVILNRAEEIQANFAQIHEPGDYIIPSSVADEMKAMMEAVAE